MIPSDPGFNGPQLTPKRISGQMIVSRQLLAQQSNDTLDRIFVNDLSRQLGNFLDASELYGLGGSNNRAQRLVNTLGVQALSFGAAHPVLCQIEQDRNQQHSERFRAGYAVSD